MTTTLNDLATGNHETESPRALTVTEQLRAVLLDGGLKADERVNEVHLTQQFNVSRTPIRAALQTLAAEGLLDYTPNRGYSVRAFAIAEIMDAYEMRALAEGLAAKLAAERGLSLEQQAAMDQALALGDRVLTATDLDIEQQRKQYSAVNAMFHQTIHQAASSRLILDVVRACQRIPQASAHNIMAFEISDVRNRHLAHHRIYEAILFRQPKQAETLMRAHVMTVKFSAARSIVRNDGQIKGPLAVSDATRKS